MKKLLKNILVFVLAFTLVFQIAGCNSSDGKIEDEKTKAAAQKLLTVWSRSLGVLDKMYESELWALDYVETYLESGQWSDLTKARVALITSVRYLEEYALPDQELTENEYELLAEAGIDTEYLKTELSALSEKLEQEYGIMRVDFLEILEFDVFSQDSLSMLQERTRLQREEISCMSRYYCVRTNELLLTLEDDSLKKEYWDTMKENYPLLSKECEPWMDVEADITTVINECNIKYEGIAAGNEKASSDLKVDLANFTKLLDAGDVEDLMDSIFLVKDMPELLPMPEWYDRETAGYLSYYFSEDGTVMYPESGDELNHTEYGMYLQITGVTAEDVEAYLESASNFAERAWEEEYGTTWYIAMPGYNVTIELEDNTATILFNGEDVTFLPGWYISLMK